MQADAIGKAAFELFDVHDVGEELAKLEGFGLQFSVPLLVRSTMKIFLVMMSDHRHATARRGDDIFERLENPQELVRQRPRSLGAAGVSHRLAAASLLARKFERHAASF